MGTNVKEVAWSDDPGHVPELPEEERELIRQKSALLEQMLREQGKAKYKVELMFRRDRSMNRPCVGLVSFWESGRADHGGGDIKIYICPNKYLGHGDCEAFLPASNQGLGMLVCPKCKSIWKGEQVIGEYVANLPLRKWSEVLLDFYRRLDHNADIYLKFARDDIRAATRAEQENPLRGEALAKVRENRPKAIYPLRNIIKDTSAGADLLARIYSFLTS